MQILKGKYLIPTFMALMAIVFIYLGLTKYGFWDNVNGPRPGFFPTIIAIILLGISLLALYQAKREEEAKIDKLEMAVVMGCLALILVSYIIGFIPSCLLYMIVWLKGFEKCTWKSTLQVTGVIAVIVISVFVFWLQVPFPWGIFDKIL